MRARSMVISAPADRYCGERSSSAPSARIGQVLCPLTYTDSSVSDLTDSEGEEEEDEPELRALNRDDARRLSFIPEDLPVRVDDGGEDAQVFLRGRCNAHCVEGVLCDAVKNEINDRCTPEIVRRSFGWKCGNPRHSKYHGAMPTDLIELDRQGSVALDEGTVQAYRLVSEANLLPCELREALCWRTRAISPSNCTVILSNDAAPPFSVVIGEREHKFKHGVPENVLWIEVPASTIVGRQTPPPFSPSSHVRKSPNASR